MILFFHQLVEKFPDEHVIVVTPSDFTKGGFGASFLGHDVIEGVY